MGIAPRVRIQSDRRADPPPARPSRSSSSARAGRRGPQALPQPARWIRPTSTWLVCAGSRPRWPGPAAEPMGSRRSRRRGHRGRTGLGDQAGGLVKLMTQEPGARARTRSATCRATGRSTAWSARPVVSLAEQAEVEGDAPVGSGPRARRRGSPRRRTAPSTPRPGRSWWWDPGVLVASAICSRTRPIAASRSGLTSWSRPRRPGARAGR